MKKRPPDPLKEALAELRRSRAANDELESDMRVYRNRKVAHAVGRLGEDSNRAARAVVRAAASVVNIGLVVFGEWYRHEVK